MADTTYQPKVYHEQGGDKLVVKSGGVLDVETGGIVKANGTQAATVAAIAAAAASAAPAGGSGATQGAYDTAANRDLLIASNNALVTLTSELKTKLDALITALKGAGIIATS